MRELNAASTNGQAEFSQLVKVRAVNNAEKEGWRPWTFSRLDVFEVRATCHMWELVAWRNT